MIKGPFKFLPLVISLMLSLSAHADVFYVIDTNDSTAVTSLRGAVIAANRAGGNNTIWLSNRSNHPIYSLTISGADEDAGLTGDMNITRGNLTIVGCTTNVTIDATGLGDRVFQVSRGARLTLENLIITGGSPTGLNYGTNIDGESGGAIYNLGTLDIQNCIFARNSSQNAPASGSAGNGGDGGAIYNVGKLTMSGCIIMQNICGTGANDQNEGGGGNGGNGGAICNLGQMDLNECIITGNSSGQGRDVVIPNAFWIVFSSWAGDGGNGAGICNYGKANLNFCTISDNVAGIGGNNFAGSGGTGGNGGGIFNAGELSVGTSTISSNTCGNGGGGGGGFAGPGGPGGGGGGIYNSASNMVLNLKSSFLKLTSTTVTLNMCGAGGNGGNDVSFVPPPNPSSGGDGGNGGGVLNNADAAAVVVRNTLIAQNLVNSGGLGGTNFEFSLYGQTQYVIHVGDPGTDGIGFDVCGNFTSKGFNLIGTGDGSVSFDNGVKADQVGTDTNMIDPLLGPLQMNGGFTPTHALLWGSPAIDQGNCFGIHQDQRGHHRPYNYPSIPKPAGGDNSDIGAFELDDKVN